jgi:hypothetical protein
MNSFLTFLQRITIYVRTSKRLRGLARPVFVTTACAQSVYLYWLNGLRLGQWGRFLTFTTYLSSPDSFLPIFGRIGQRLESRS